MKKYNDELKIEIIRQHLEEGRSKKSLTEEYELGQGTLTYWLQNYRKNPENKEALNESAEMLRLRKELIEVKKENEFLKKASAFFAKEMK